MCSVQEMQRIDRELSSELVESPINPAFINISAPCMGKKNPSFSLQLNGEGLWQWRKLHSHNQVFDSLQASLVKVGYELLSSARSRVGMAVYRRVLVKIYLTDFYPYATLCIDKASQLYDAMAQLRWGSEGINFGQIAFYQFIYKYYKENIISNCCLRK